MSTQDDAVWRKAKRDYVTSSMTYRQVMEKYGLKLTTVQKRALREKWPEIREQQKNATDDRAIEKFAAKILESKADSKALAQIEKLQRAGEHLIKITEAKLALMADVADQCNGLIVDESARTALQKVKPTDMWRLMDTLKGAAQITRDLYDIPDIVRQHTMQLNEARLEIDQRKVALEDGDTDINVEFTASKEDMELMG